jgi:hypothetical protein
MILICGDCGKNAVAAADVYKPNNFYINLNC